MGRVFKGINITVSIVLVVAAAAVAYVALPFFGNQALIVRSGSMQPAIDIGSIVVVRPNIEHFISPLADTVQYKTGDIIAFRSEKNSKTIVTHRVTSIEPGEKGVFYKTKGDANEEPDNWSVNPKNILGKVYFALPQAGKLLAFAKSKVGFSLLIIFPAVLVILMEIFSIIKHIRNGKKNFGFSSAGLKLVIPLLAVGLAIPITFALQQDTETSTDNIFQAAAEFPTPTPTPTPTPPITDHLVINEVMFDPPNTNACESENNAEWVEIYNPTGSSVNLDTWSAGDTNSTDDLPNVSLPAGGFAIVASDCSESNFDSIWNLPNGTIYIDLAGTLGNGLNNGGEHIRLFNGATLIDGMSYGSSIAAFSPSVTAPVSGHSLERDPDGIDTNTAADFVDRTTPQPGL